MGDPGGWPAFQHAGHAVLDGKDCELVEVVGCDGQSNWNAREDDRQHARHGTRVILRDVKARSELGSIVTTDTLTVAQHGSEDPGCSSEAESAHSER